MESYSRREPSAWTRVVQVCTVKVTSVYGRTLKL